MAKLNLYPKSEAAYKKAVQKLQDLGADMFLLGGYKTIDGYGVCVWVGDSEDFRGTDGLGGGDRNFTSRKEFIKTVKELL